MAWLSGRVLVDSPSEELVLWLEHLFSVKTLFTIAPPPSLSSFLYPCLSLKSHYVAQSGTFDLPTSES